MEKEMPANDIEQARRILGFKVLKLRALILAICILTCIHIYNSFSPFTETATTPPFSYLSNHCANASPISASEFHSRQISLARTLHSLNASAYIAEPGASAQYYANISASQWKLSERPLLLVISPEIVGESGEVRAKVSVLTPTFEATRAKLLPIPAADVGFAEWPEDADPYEIATSLIPPEGTVFVDDSIRHFIVDGLQAAKRNSKVVSAPVEIRRLRERKSPAEIDLLRCANEATVLAIRAVHQKLYFSVRESQALQLMQSALSAAGLTDGSCLVLFGENAALPHGSGTDRTLGKSDFALFDCGGTLHGYQSDVTRTIALPDSTITSEHLIIWDLVRSAQTEAFSRATQGALTRFPDEGARDFLDAMGYGKYFTHRLGHGIGLEGHESPYLRGGSDDIIEIGHTFSNEPGVYIARDMGVRLEDCFYIAETGLPVMLTAGVGGQARTPWEP